MCSALPLKLLAMAARAQAKRERQRENGEQRRREDYGLEKEGGSAGGQPQTTSTREASKHQ